MAIRLSEVYAMGFNCRQTSPGECTRRGFLKGVGLFASAVTAMGLWQTTVITKRADAHWQTTVKYRPDLLDSNSPKGLEVIQLTTDTEVPSAHVYMESQIFTMD